MGATRLFVFRRADDPSVRATFAVRHGDVLHMHADCQEHWQHSVVREQPGSGGGARGSAPPRDAPLADAARVSFVFKRRWAAETLLPPAEPPAAYTDALRQLRAAAARGGWPPAGAARARVLRGCGGGAAGGGGQALTLARPGAARRPPRANARFPELAAALFALEAAIRPAAAAGELSALCFVTVDAELTPHALPPTRGGAPALIVALGGGAAADGGAVVVGGGPPRDVRYRPLLLAGGGAEGEGGGAEGEGGSGAGVAMWTLPVHGGGGGGGGGGDGGNGGDGEGGAAAAAVAPLFHVTFFSPAPAETAAALAAKLAPPLRYRAQSTDELVLGELLGPRAAYAGPPRGDPRWDWDAFGPEPFSPAGHAVLDIGAQAHAACTHAHACTRAGCRHA